MDDDALDQHVARYAEPDEEAALRATVLARLDWRIRNGYKTCAKCTSKKPPAVFSVDSSKSDGLRAYCRTCVAAYDAQRRNV